MMSILIIGCGFIGRSLLTRFIAEGCSVRVVDRNPCPSQFLGKVDWFLLDLVDISAHQYILEDVQCVYHLASSTVPGDLFHDFTTDIIDNVLSLTTLLDLCLQYNVSRFVFASSSSVYGDCSTYPILESHPCFPISSHGLCKSILEKVLILKTRNTTLSPRILRISNPYGPGQNPHGRQGFIAIALGSLISGQILQLRNPDSTIRDFIYIDDLTLALFLAGVSGCSPAILNISSGVGVSLTSVVSAIQILAKQSLLTSPSPSRDQDILVSVLDPSLAYSSLHFRASHSLEDGLKKFLSYHNIPLLEPT